MKYRFELSDEERDLILGLLETERRELPTEIRHTDRRGVHDELQQKLKLVDTVMDHLRHPEMQPA